MLLTVLNVHIASIFYIQISYIHPDIDHVQDDDIFLSCVTQNGCHTYVNVISQVFVDILITNSMQVLCALSPLQALETVLQSRYNSSTVTIIILSQYYPPK